jgi:hypothetical protein
LAAQREKVPKFPAVTWPLPEKHFLRWQTRASALKYCEFLDQRNTFLGRLGFTGDYSLVLGAHIEQRGAGQTNFDLAASAVPEPAAMLLCGTGVVGLAVLSRKRRKDSLAD